MKNEISNYWDGAKNIADALGNLRQKRNQKPPSVAKVEKQKQYFDSLRKEVRQAKVLTPELLFQKIQKRHSYQANGEKLNFGDVETNRIYKLLLNYFCGIESELDLGKGICLIGETGVGKSTALKLFVHSLGCHNGSTAIISMQELNRNFIQTKGECLQRYLNTEFLLLDDVGHERQVSSYGNTFLIFEELIHARYEAKRITHMTTNFGDPSFHADRYGKHIADRMIKMFNFVNWGGQSKRY